MFTHVIEAKYIYLVPTLLRGNASGDAPASWDIIIKKRIGLDYNLGKE